MSPPLIWVLLVVGCRSVGTDRGDASVEPFEVVLGRGAAWPHGRQGYDPDLPGYHIDGQIASITIRPRSRRPPEKLILAIRTSPGMPPMLENFSLIGPDLTLSSAMKLELAEVRSSQGDPSGCTASTLRGNTYFRFEVAGSRVRVTLLPDAMKLLKRDCTISWVDWYR